MNIKDTIISKMNELGSKRTPFLFVIDFNGQEGEVIPLCEVNPNEILYSFNQVTNKELSSNFSKPKLVSYPISYENYKISFDKVMHEISIGNTYLINLTVATPLEIEERLLGIYSHSKAKYKLWYKDEFVCFSPEIFVQIKENTIYSFPMKGTIDASIPNAEQLILGDKKETAEHYTIVDLIRNDLNIVSKKVKVDRFRYVDEIKTSKGSLLQISSQISGTMPDDWQSTIGDIFNKLLPAGSITGSPKAKTVEIIQRVEGYERGFYCGVCGVFDGDNIDSAVMIRFIEKQGDNYFYKSGGGITFASIAKNEYDEILKKIYTQ